MNIYSEVKLDLFNAHLHDRNKFYEVLSKDQWISEEGMGSTWIIYFEYKISGDEALEIIKNSLKKAKTSVKIPYKVSITMSYKPIDLVG